MLPAGASFAFSVGAHLARDSKLIFKHVFKMKTPANSSIFSIFGIIYAENLAAQQGSANDQDHWIKRSLDFLFLIRFFFLDHDS